MRGISEEMLNKCYDSALRMGDKISIPGLEIALAMCTELNPLQPIESAPKDREIVVFAPGCQGLNPIITICKWHESAGFCIDELRQPTLWMEVPK